MQTQVCPVACTPSVLCWARALLLDAVRPVRYARSPMHIWHKLPAMRPSLPPPQMRPADLHHDCVEMPCAWTVGWVRACTHSDAGLTAFDWKCPVRTACGNTVMVDAIQCRFWLWSLPWATARAGKVRTPAHNGGTRDALRPTQQCANAQNCAADGSMQLIHALNEKKQTPQHHLSVVTYFG